MDVFLWGKKHLWHRGSPCTQVVATRRAKSDGSWECPLAPSSLPSTCQSSLLSLDPRSVTPWPLDVSSLEHTLAPTPPPLPFWFLFLFFKVPWSVVPLEHHVALREPQDEGSTPSSWCRVQATDLARLKATGVLKPKESKLHANIRPRIPQMRRVFELFVMSWMWSVYKCSQIGVFHFSQGWLSTAPLSSTRTRTVGQQNLASAENGFLREICSRS